MLIKRTRHGSDGLQGTSSVKYAEKRSTCPACLIQPGSAVSESDACPESEEKAEEVDSTAKSTLGEFVGALALVPF